MNILRTIGLFFGMFIAGGVLANSPILRVRNYGLAVGMAIGGIVLFQVADCLLPYTWWSEVIIFVVGAAGEGMIIRLLVSSDRDEGMGKKGSRARCRFSWGWR